MSTKKWRVEHKEDMLRYSREWYYRNKQSVIDRGHKNRAETKKWLLEFKSGLKCELCGMSHIACLHFHHKNPKEKDKSIAKTINAGWSKKRILKEIEKCQILCANCHSIFHWKE